MDKADNKLPLKWGDGESAPETQAIQTPGLAGLT